MSMLKYISCCVMAAVVATACEKTGTYDIQGDPEVKFFTNIESPGNAPSNSISFTVVNIPNTAGAGWENLSSTLPDAIRFPVLASRPVSQDVTIGAELDNSLIAAYNTANNTNYKPFPAGLLNTDGLTAHLMAGENSSMDSIAITTSAASLNTLTEEAYMAPVKLTTVSDPKAGAITGNSISQVVYIVVNVERRRIRFDAPASAALGALISPRTSWTYALTPDPISTVGGGSILDGSNSSYSRWGVSPGQVDVNMQATHNVTGIRLFTTTSTNNSPTQVEVLLSEDGINYDHIGSPLRADLTYSSGVTYILFYKAITAKYVRLLLHYSTSTSSNNRRIAELDVYAE